MKKYIPIILGAVLLLVGAWCLNITVQDFTTTRMGLNGMHKYGDLVITVLLFALAFSLFIFVLKTNKNNDELPLNTLAKVKMQEKK